jgi:hypothetical protein
MRIGIHPSMDRNSYKLTYRNIRTDILNYSAAFSPQPVGRRVELRVLNHHLGSVSYCHVPMWGAA